jgi:uncharacterized membrane protein YfcA
MTLMDMVLHEAVYVFIGVFAGMIAGALGIGGGVVVVPGLVFLFQINQAVPFPIIMHVAVGTSLAIMIFTSIASLKAHANQGEILWPIFNKLWPGIIIGSCVGALAAQFIPTAWLKIIFALFLLLVALKMGLDLHKKYAKQQFPRNWINRLVSFVIGVKSGLLGVGGGVLIVPYLTYCGVPVRQIAPVSNLCTLTVAVIGSLVFMLTGLKDMSAIAYSTGYIYWPAVLGVAIPSALLAPVGAKLNYVLPIYYLKYGFIVILILTALKMLF